MSNPFDQFDAPAPAPATPTANANPFDQFDAVSTPAVAPAAPEASFGRRAALGARDVLEGVVGPAYNLAALPFQKAGVQVNSFGQNLTAMGLPEPQTDGERMTSSIARPIAGTLMGQGIGRAMMGAASPVAQGVGQMLTTQPVTQAAAAGVGGAVHEATGSPWAGFAASLAVPFAGAAIGRTISPDILGNISPTRAAVLATADQENIPLTLAQMTGGKVARNFESTLANLPGSSGTQAAVNDAQMTAWNAAVLARSGTVATEATPDVLNAARARIGQQFNDLTARNTMQPDQQMLGEVQAMAGQVQRYVPESQRGPIMARIEDLVAGINGNNGTLPGPAYQQMDSALGGAIRSTTDGFARTYLGQLRDSMRGAMDRSITPADQQAWGEARQQYGMLMQTAKAMDRPSEGTSLGNVSPAALAQATRNAPSRSFAFGRGGMDDLARLGQVALKQTVPDSGTAQRTMMANLLSGGNIGATLAAGGGALASGQNPLYALAVPAISTGLPRAAAAAYHSDALRNYLTNDLVSGLTPQPNTLLSLGIGAESGTQRLRDR